MEIVRAILIPTSIRKYFLEKGDISKDLSHIRVKF